MSQFFGSFKMFRLALVVFAVFAAVLIGLTLPSATYASGPASAPAQSAPIEGSIFPALLQVALIVLVTEGVKSLARALGGTNPDGSPKLDLKGREAAIAYIVVGVVVYALQAFLLPALPAQTAEALTQLLAVVATLLAGSGLFSMTSAFRLPAK